MKEKSESKMTREEFEKRRADRKQQRLLRRAERIADANRILSDDDCPIKRMKAQHILSEEAIAQRIDDLRQELEDIRNRNRIELRRIRQRTNGKLARSKRRVSPSFIHITKRKINEILDYWERDKQKSLLDLLPDHQGHDDTISYEEIARRLNSQGHKTLYDRERRRTTVIGFMRRYMEDSLDKVGHEPNATQAAQDGLKAKVKAYDKYMRDEVLPMIDMTEKHHIIAKELNKRGIKTRLGKDWGNVAVSRMLKRIEQLEE